MSQTAQRYPVHDPAEVDRLVCPLSGKPILRAKDAATADTVLRKFDVEAAVERTLGRSGPDRIWVAREHSLSQVPGGTSRRGGSRNGG